MITCSGSGGTPAFIQLCWFSFRGLMVECGGENVIHGGDMVRGQMVVDGGLLVGGLMVYARGLMVRC